jgi:sterol desaturase/sphingolipid hydroxylase (fatty acid hydroxylase superfamily)
VAAISRWTAGLGLSGYFIVVLAAERAWPLRAAVESKARRLVRNTALAGVWLAALAALQTPLLVAVTQWSAERRFGLLHLVPLPPAVEAVVALVLFDYTLWFWHWANHKIPFLWRFHVVHHVDLDLDASTALRFHVGEMLMSVPYRAAQALLIGADVASLNLYQLVLMASILFHHSNVRLPYAFERALVRLVVTPRMHGIHHSTYEHETNSNYSSFLSAWDYLHRTIRLNVPQAAVRIGVPAYQDEKELTLANSLVLPFRPHKRYWSGSDPAPPRPHSKATPSELVP